VMKNLKKQPGSCEDCFLKTLFILYRCSITEYDSFGGGENINVLVAHDCSLLLVSWQSHVFIGKTRLELQCSVTA
jgi:hypothetical protein